jgi:hypothetical protein
MLVHNENSPCSYGESQASHRQTDASSSAVPDALIFQGSLVCIWIQFSEMNMSPIKDFILSSISLVQMTRYGKAMTFFFFPHCKNFFALSMALIFHLSRLSGVDVDHPVSRSFPRCFCGKASVDGSCSHWFRIATVSRYHLVNLPANSFISSYPTQPYFRNVSVSVH